MIKYFFHLSRSHYLCAGIFHSLFSHQSCHLQESMTFRVRDAIFLLFLLPASRFTCVMLLFFLLLHHRIVRVRETRITQIISHILIGLSIFLVPYPLAYIPTAVLDGLFLYMAVTSLSGNQMFERITLLFMEQVK